MCVKFSANTSPLIPLRIEGGSAQRWGMPQPLRIEGGTRPWILELHGNASRVGQHENTKSRGMKNQHGFTLIELIVIVIVISIVAIALLGVFTTGVARSADPMLDMQAIGIAQGYLDEALLKEFDDPTVAESGTCEALETRPTYDDVQDYDCVNDTGGALDQYGNPLAGLADYNVDVNVNAAALGGLAVQQVDVIVTHDDQGSLNITLTGFRANY
jgi:MSHA pilin protein MshD